MMHRSTTTAHLVASWSRPLSPWIDAFSTMFELVDATTPTHVPPLPPMVLHMLARRTSERVVDVDNKHVATAKSSRKRQDAHDCLVTTNQGAAPSPLDTNFEMRVIRLSVLTERGAEWALKIPLPALREIVVANGNATSHAASLVSRFSSITRLQLCNTSCCALPAVPWATLASLTEISLHLVSLRTEDLQGIDALPALRRLDLRGCKCSSPVTQLSSNSLEEITFRDMWVGKFDGLEALPSLRKLTAIDLVGTVDVTALSHCQALQELYVGPAIRTNKCDRCTGCLDTSEMHALRKLTLYGVDTLPVLGAGCAPLEYLELTDVKSLSGVEAIDTLKTLIVRCSPSLLNVTSLARCKSLTSLTIDAPWLETAGTLGLEAIATLTQLSLAGCSKVDSVAHLGKSQSLKTLVVPANVRPSGLSGLELIPTLEVLSLAGCRYIANVEHLALAPALHTLNLNGTRIHVDGVAALAKLPTLRSLSMSHCARLKDLRWLNNSSIEVLTANGSGLRHPDEHIKGICLPKLQSISLHSSDDKFQAMCKKHRVHHPAQF